MSGEVTASAPIVVERAMYRNLSGQPFGLGHDSMGVTSAATSWFLAEGATGTFFDLYLLIANPGSTGATVRADYARPDGSVVTQSAVHGPRTAGSASSSIPSRASRTRRWPRR